MEAIFSGKDGVTTSWGECDASATTCTVKKLVWCSELCYKAYTSESRSQVSLIATDVGAQLECFKKANTFGRWLGKENPNIVYLLTDWREAKPCSDEIIQASEELDLGKIIMVVLCTEKKTASRAQTWVGNALKDPRRLFYPRVVRSFSEVQGFLQQITCRLLKKNTHLRSGKKYKMPPPVHAPPKPLNWTQMPHIPPPHAHGCSVEPQVMPPLVTASSVQMPVCPGAWKMPQPLLSIPTKVAELPQPSRILNQRTAPSVPPLPECLGKGLTGSLATSAAETEADADAAAGADAEARMEPQFEDVDRLRAKLLEFGAWVPSTMAPESAAAAAAGAEADAEMLVNTVSDLLESDLETEDTAAAAAEATAEAEAETFATAAKEEEMDCAADV